jgi:glyoxylate carboligase
MAKIVADQFVETLVAAGVKRIYGIVGDSLNGLTDAVRRHGKIEWIHVKHTKGSVTGAMNFLVFVMTALAAPAIGWWMQELAAGAALTLDVFVEVGSVYVAAIVVAAILTLLLKETGSAVRGAD